MQLIKADNLKDASLKSNHSFFYDYTKNTEFYNAFLPAAAESRFEQNPEIGCVRTQTNSGAMLFTLWNACSPPLCQC